MSDIKIPEMGESIVEGTISKWHVKEGDQVGQGDVLAELETDKVNMEISAEQSGVVEKILRQEGETVSVGETIGVIGAGAGGAASAGDSGKTESAAPAAPEAKPEPAPAAAAPKAEA
ncbi:biotin/lipoyl-binding protein, partial [Paenibacillus sepulcri]|nr:biotin/lipoyl-binding protein [Paenibacillus sepulcri]